MIFVVAAVSQLLLPIRTNSRPARSNRRDAAFPDLGRPIVGRLQLLSVTQPNYRAYGTVLSASRVFPGRG